MNEYEILVETINPCGGEAHAQKTFLEAACESPEAYVAENGRYPVMDSAALPNGDLRIVTGDGKGSMVRYTFSLL